MDYQLLMEAFENLKKEILTYYAKNAYGELPVLDGESIDDLKKKYQDVFDKASRFMNGVPEKKEDISEEMRTRYQNADAIQTLLQKDINALDLAAPGKTLGEIMSYGNDRRVDVTGKTFKIVGDQASQRQMMTITGPDGKPMRGFFTERGYFGYDPSFIPFYIQKFTRNRPEFKAMYEEIIPRIFGNISGGPMPAKWQFELKGKYGQIPDFETALKEMNTFNHNRFDTFAQGQLNLNDENPLSAVDTKNVGMSNIARLLGMEHMIARTTNLTLVNNGQEIKGSFMEFASGEDPSGPPLDGNLMHLKPGACDNTMALKSLADMQVLDFICANMDRHGRNLFYQFDDQGKLSGFCGIDNDMSFSTKTTGLTYGNSRGEEAIFHMSRSMYDKIMMLDEHALRHALDGLEIEDKAIEAVAGRVKVLKDRVRDGKALVIEDKDYESFKLKDFIPGKPEGNTFTYGDKTIPIGPDKDPRGGGASLFSNINTVLGKFENLSPASRYNFEHPEEVAQKALERKMRDKNYVPVPEGKNSKDQLEMEVQADKPGFEIGMDVPELDNMLTNTKLANKHVFFGSTEYQKVLESLEVLRNATDKFAKAGGEPTEKNLKGLQEAYQSVQKKCREYLVRKKNQGKLNVDPLSKTGKRIAAVQEALNFCKERDKALDIALNGPAEDRELSDMHKEAQKMLNARMKPEEVGQTIKELNRMHLEEPENRTLTVRAAEQVKMFKEYMLSKKISPEECGLTHDDLMASKELVAEGRRINAELQQKQPDMVKEGPKKASVLGEGGPVV